MDEEDRSLAPQGSDTATVGLVEATFTYTVEQKVVDMTDRAADAYVKIADSTYAAPVRSMMRWTCAIMVAAHAAAIMAAVLGKNLSFEPAVTLVLIGVAPAVVGVGGVGLYKTAGRLLAPPPRPRDGTR